MQPSGFHYFPIAWPFFVMLAAIFIFVVILVELHILSYAYARMGIHPRYIFLIMLVSLLGSYINIPIAHLPPERVVSNEVVDFFGVQYVIPVVQNWPGTVIALNIGGALVPTLLSFYLLFKNRLFVRGIFATAVVAYVVHLLAHPTRGVGITVPIFVPPLIAAAIAVILAWRQAPPLAYIAGSLGTLIGADLLNLGNIAGLGAPIASIGGAGTFDGIFLTGIIAVLLPPFGMPPPLPPNDREETATPQPPPDRIWGSKWLAPAGTPLVPRYNERFTGVPHARKTESCRRHVRRR
jgi:uncharacterized membrane protein